MEFTRREFLKKSFVFFAWGMIPNIFKKEDRKLEAKEKTKSSHLSLPFALHTEGCEHGQEVPIQNPLYLPIITNA